MVIGILQFELHIHGSESLKDKRRVVRSVKDRLHREHMVSVAEVAAQDMLNVAVLGLACVGADGQRVAGVLDNVSNKLRSVPGAELGSITRQVIHGSQLDMEPEEPLDEEALAREMMDHFKAGPPGQEHR